jgi:hypothetical protein
MESTQGIKQRLLHTHTCFMSHRVTLCDHGVIQMLGHRHSHTSCYPCLLLISLCMLCYQITV